MQEMSCNMESLKNPAPEARNPAGRPFARQWPSRIVIQGKWVSCEEPNSGLIRLGICLLPRTRRDPGLKV